LLKVASLTPHLAVNLVNSGAYRCLLERKGNLLFGKPALFHGMSLFSIGEISCRIFYTFKWLSFSGQGHSGRVILQFFKKERFRKRNYRTRYLTCAYVFNHIEVFYNRTQIHSHLGGVCPEAFESASNRGLSLSTVLEEHCEIFKKHLRNTYLVNSY
jgi:hypothetical protein